MCGIEPQARRVSDFVARVTQVLEDAQRDGRIDQAEFEQIARLVREGNETYVQSANEVATGMEEIKLIIAAGPLEPLHPTTRGKIVSIAEGRIRRDERRKKEEAAARANRNGIRQIRAVER